MNTDFSFTLACSFRERGRAERALNDAFQAVECLENEISEFRPESPVYQFNRAKAGEAVMLSDAGAELYRLSVQVSELTDGAFSPWAKGQGTGLFLSHGLLTREDEKNHLGFGAIGKGYALDRVRLDLDRAGFQDYCLSAGGSSIVVSGVEKSGSPWKIGWRGSMLESIKGRPVAIGVSGLDEQMGHLLNPQTSAAVQTSVASAWVATGSAARADAYSTALFVMGWERFRDVASRWIEAPAIAVETQEGQRWWNGLFQSLFGGVASFLVASVAWGQEVGEGEAVDLAAMGLDAFAPYVVERNLLWVLLPAIALAITLTHLIRPRLNIHSKTPLDPRFRDQLRPLGTPPPFTHASNSGSKEEPSK